MAKNRNTKQKSTAGSPPFMMGQTPRGKWTRKNATASSPLAMNAAHGVNRPSVMRLPPTTSRSRRPATRWIPGPTTLLFWRGSPPPQDSADDPVYEYDDPA